MVVHSTLELRHRNNMADPSELSKIRKKRRVAKGSITCIETRLNALEGETDRPNTRDAARQMLAKLKEHDADFRKNHLTLIDLVEDDETLIAEQATQDENDDLIASLTVRILALADATSPTSTREVSPRELLVRRCSRLESRLSETDTALSSLSHEDVCRLQQHQEQLSNFKRESAEIGNALLLLTLDDSDVLLSMIADLEKKLFDCSLHLKELSRSDSTVTTPTRSDPKGIKLPKLDVPVFNGNILN